MFVWNAFLVIRNEEAHIADIINALKMQNPPPTRILVANDGSTDNTGKILDSISGIDVTHYDPHPHDLLSGRFSTLRDRLFREACNKADYVVCVDGDTLVSSTYMGEIVGRMQRDRVVIACGQDPRNKLRLVADSPTVIDVRWLKNFQHPTRTSSVNGSLLLIHASLTGFRSAVYTDIRVDYKRTVGANYSKRMMEGFGRSFKQNGFSFWYVFVVAVKRRKLSYIRGYMSAKNKCLDPQVASWNKRYQRERVFGRLGVRRLLLRDTDNALYVEPAQMP